MDYPYMANIFGGSMNAELSHVAGVDGVPQGEDMKSTIHGKSIAASGTSTVSRESTGWCRALARKTGAVVVRWHE